jgi:hypothetical protein
MALDENSGAWHFSWPQATGTYIICIYMCAQCRTCSETAAADVAPFNFASMAGERLRERVTCFYLRAFMRSASYNWVRGRFNYSQCKRMNTLGRALLLCKLHSLLPLHFLAMSPLALPNPLYVSLGPAKILFTSNAFM